MYVSFHDLRSICPSNPSIHSSIPPSIHPPHIMHLPCIHLSTGTKSVSSQFNHWTEPCLEVGFPITSGSSGKHKVVKAQPQIPTLPTPGLTPRQLQKISHKGVRQIQLSTASELLEKLTEENWTAKHRGRSCQIIRRMWEKAPALDAKEGPSVRQKQFTASICRKLNKNEQVNQPTTHVE